VRYAQQGAPIATTLVANKQGHLSKTKVAVLTVAALAVGNGGLVVKLWYRNF